jgi:hypothetical protein
MAVSSVSSGGNASASTAAKTQVRAQQSERDQDAQKAQKAENDRTRAEREAAQNNRIQAEKNKPSVNTSGHTVGQRVNTTA